jgi:hypothetical protein
MTTRIFVLSALLSLLTLPLFGSAAQAQFGQAPYGQDQSGQSRHGSPYGISQFRWEGVVDGTSYVRIARNRVWVTTRSGLPVQRQRYDFSDPLPRAWVDLQLVVLDGRGRVQLVETPRAGNDYTAVVRIDDRSGGRDLYRFELRWADRTRQDGDYRDPVRIQNLVWSGRVDGEALLYIRRTDVSINNLNGQGVWEDRYRFTAPLPSVPVAVNLVNTRGRGEVVLVEQPNRRNNFTALVRIRDSQGGAGHYSFTLAWEPLRQRNTNDDDDWRDERDTGQRGLRWVGRVDGRDILLIKDRRIWFEHQAGAPICEDQARFFTSLPARHCELSVRKVRGRGHVQVLERPSPFNDYTAKVLIDDRDGGADFYELEFFW